MCRWGRGGEAGGRVGRVVVVVVEVEDYMAAWRTERDSVVAVAVRIYHTETGLQHLVE